MTKLSGRVICILAGIGILSGCAESREATGVRCPAKSGIDLSYIVTSDGERINRGSESKEFARNFETNTCPLDFPVCSRDNTKSYYCMKTCKKKEMNCEGRCINSLTDHDFCGAELSPGSVFVGCRKGSYKQCGSDESCVNGKCVSSDGREVEEEPSVTERELECEDSEVKCEEGELYQCEEGEWEATKTCATNACASDVACADETTERCTTSKCEGNLFYQCEKGYVREPVTCEGYCDETEGCLECQTSVDKPMCVGNILKKCENNKWVERDCEVDGSICNSEYNRCMCKPGSVICQSSTRYECGNDGWMPVEDCGSKTCTPEGCVDGVVTPPDPGKDEPDPGKDDPDPGTESVCTAGVTKCVGTTVYVCSMDGKQWNIQEDCSATGGLCDGGKCVGGSTDTPSTPSTPSSECNSWEAKCEGNVLKTCPAGKWQVQEDCAATGKTCSGNQCVSSAAPCQSSCDANGILTVCDSNGVSYQAHCPAQNKVCDSKTFTCVDAKVSCVDTRKMKLTLGSTVFVYDCSNNESLIPSDYSLSRDVRDNIFCNPNFGCAPFVCSGGKKLLTSYDPEGENCAEDYASGYCTNDEDSCFECNPSTFKPTCKKDSDGWYVYTTCDDFGIWEDFCEKSTCSDCK